MHPREVAIVGVVVLLVLVPWLVVRDIWRRPGSEWRAAGRSRWAWTLCCLLVPVVGPVWYLRVVRPAVRPPNRTGPA